MHHQFWTFRPMVQGADEGWGVEIPAGVMPGTYSSTNPGDIYVAQGGGAHAEGAHDHLVSGGNFGLPSAQISDQHFHQFVRWQNSGGDWSIFQETFNGADHEHTATIYSDLMLMIPEYSMFLITCTEETYTLLTVDESWVVLAERENIGTEEEPAFAPLSTDAWAAPYRTGAENLIKAGIGLIIPTEVNNDKRFIMWLLDIAGTRPGWEDEEKHFPPVQPE